MAQSKINETKIKNEPEAVFHWKDTLTTGAEGWVVWDRIINGVAGGGIFMHAAATQKETEDIARNMSRKFTVCDPQIGGAKAGIRFDHLDPRASGVLQRFLVWARPLLENVWVTAGDLNTNDEEIERIIQTDLGLPTCQSALGRRIAQVTKSRDRCGSLAQLIQFNACAFFPMIEGAVGYGVAEAIRVALELAASSSSGLKPSEQDEKAARPRVLIQGFGAVGSSLAYFLHERKIACVVGIADKDGFVHAGDDRDGLPIAELLELRRRRKIQLQQERASAHVVAECAKNLLCNLTDEEASRLRIIKVRREPSMTAEAFFCAFLRCQQAEIICPCAQRYQITTAVVDVLERFTWAGSSSSSAKICSRFIVSGANNPMGVVMGPAVVEDAEGKVMARLLRAGACVVPDWVANSGTAQLFHRGLSLDFDLRLPNAAEQVLQACAQPIASFMLEAFLRHQVSSSPLRFEGDVSSPQLGSARGAGVTELAALCERLARERLEKPIAMRPVTTTGEHRSIYALPPLPTARMLDLDQRLALCLKVAANPTECIEIDELRQLLRTCPNPVAYDGFEPSGRMHVAQGLFKTLNVNRLTRSGFTFVFWVADWFAYLNLKMGGDLDKIQTVGQYFIKVWQAAGMDLSRVRFLWASEEIKTRPDEYWRSVFKIATASSLARIQRCGQIMGRHDEEKLQASQIIYPCMQCADIEFLGVDVAQLGLDQRKVNMLGREVLAHKPIILSHAMLPGLKEGQEKMSKSDPASSIYMEDSAEDVTAKINGAFCPAGELEHNPCLSYLEHLVFGRYGTDEGGPGVVLRRAAKFGGDKKYGTFAEFCQDYKSGAVHPKDLKAMLAFYLNEQLEPVRRFFETDAEARLLLETVKSFRVQAGTSTEEDRKTENKQDQKKPPKKGAEDTTTEASKLDKAGSVTATTASTSLSTQGALKGKA